MKHNYAPAFLVAGIIAIVALSVFFVSSKSGMASVPLCPDGLNAIMVSVPGGGNQIVECTAETPIGPTLGKFDTYYANPQGDLRRQQIAQRGFNPQYYYNLADEGMQ